MMAGCEGMANHADQTAPNLCAEHCQYGEQSDQLRTPLMPAVCLISLYVVPPVAPATEWSPFVILSSGLLTARPPPHAILHCCFRI